MVSPAALSIILTTFAEGPERNRALSVWGAIAGAGGAVGLLLGGVLVQALSWRWVFFVNVPIGAAVLVLAPRIVPESRSESAAKGGYDVEGAVAITLGTLALVFTLIKADSWGWTSGRTIAGFVVSAALIVAFVAIERRHKDPLLPLRIFSNRSLSASNATLLVVVAALFGMFFFVTLYLQQVLGFSALKTGLAYLPLSLTLIGSSVVASRFVDRFTPKPILVAGLLISTGGFVFLTSVSGHADYGTHVVPAMIILGVGFGMSFVPVTIAGTSGVAPADSGIASGLLNTTQQVGGSLGLAILSSIATSRTTSAVHTGLALPAALTHGFKGAFLVAGALCALGAVFAIALLPSSRRDPANEQVEVLALSFARCPGAPYCGYLARAVALGRRVRTSLARS
jgi:EmrB/QacA subfamily drug resistance transporter